MSPVALQIRYGNFSIVQAELPGHGLLNLGVLLEDPETNSLRLRFRRDLDSLVDNEDDLDVLSGLSGDLTSKAAELGAGKLVEYLENTLGGSVRISDREKVSAADFDRAIDRLYREHVPTRVQEFRTHLPHYSLQVAAGKFLENEEVTEEGWIEAPEDLRLDDRMFVAQIAGHSMEPRIPDGSLCVFRSGVPGSRQDRLVLVEHLEATGSNRYAVKLYKSEKVSTEEGWHHKQIRLVSLNPDYPSWNLDSDEQKYRIIAEFVRVLN